MSPEMSKTILTLAGVVISVLLTILGYFLNKHINVTEALTQAVNSLNTTVKGLEISQANLSVSMNEKNAITEKRLDAHAKTINEHSVAITELKAISSNHKKSTIN